MNPAVTWWTPYTDPRPVQAGGGLLTYKRLHGPKSSTPSNRRSGLQEQKMVYREQELRSGELLSPEILSMYMGGSF